jgi:uncharacterized membrane protein
LGERHYNLIAGTSIERLAALSDGVFAVAMTLLVLDLHVPDAALIHSDADLIHALLQMAPRVLVYMLSFMTLGIFWVGQQTQLNQCISADRDFSWIHLIFLFAVSLMPFSTGLMAGFVALRAALIIYWLNILLLGAMLLMSWRLAVKHRLVQPEALPLSRAIERRIIVAQTLYAAGAALCIINTTCSLIFIISLQLYYAAAPKPLRRLIP